MRRGYGRPGVRPLFVGVLATAACYPGRAASIGAGAPEPTFSTDAAAVRGAGSSSGPDAMPPPPDASGPPLPNASGPPPPDASGPLLTVAPLVDKPFAERAARDYLAFHRQLCESLRRKGARAARLLDSVGLPDDEDPVTHLCAGPGQATPVASGSFLVVGADEVVLQTRSGAAAAWGETTLALMRRNGAQYVLVRHFLAAGKFEPRLRVRVAGAADLLFMCAVRGNGGVYSAECGVLGQGAFSAFAIRPGGPDGKGSSVSDNELQTVTTLGCGPTSWVDLQKIGVSDARLVATLAVVEADRFAANADEGGDECTGERNRRERRFSIRYSVEIASPNGTPTVVVRRIDPIPAEVTRVLDRY